MERTFNIEKYFQISPEKCLLWIVIIAISIRLLVMILLQTWEFKIPSLFFHESGEIGAAIVEGLGFSWPANSNFSIHGKPLEPTSQEPPVYPLINAAVFKVFGIYSTASAIVLIIFQAITSALCCVLLFFIGRRVFNAWVGVIAALVLALYPSEMHFAVQKVQSTILLQVFLLLFIYQFLRLAETPTIKKSILTGAIFGIAALTNPAIFALFPFALGWLFFKGSTHLKARIINTIIVFLTVWVTISPWLIRNYLVFDRFVFIKSNLSREFLTGNYKSSGTRTSRIKDRQNLTTLDEGQKSEFYREKFIGLMLKNPGRFVKKTSRRFTLFWTSTPRKGGPREKTSGVKDFISGIIYLFILILGITGICLTRLRGRDVQLLFLTIVSLPIPYYLTWFSRYRYRYPIEPFLILFTSYAMYRLWKLLKVKAPVITLR